jgi:hypothetical protein
MSPLDDIALHPINIRELQGSYLFDKKGDVIGKIGDVLVTAEDKPQWLIVSFGAFLHEDRIVPAFELERHDTGYSVDYDKERIHEAPVVGVANMSEEDEDKLNSYWCSERGAALPSACAIWTA